MYAIRSYYVLAAAIAPDSAQGRAGAVLGRFAGKAADKAEAEGREDAIKEEKWGREDMLDEKNWNRTTGQEDKIRGLTWSREDKLTAEERAREDARWKEGTTMRSLAEQSAQQRLENESMESSLLKNQIEDSYNFV